MWTRMSIISLNIKYVIIFSLLQYSSTMVLKSPKYYMSRYIKKQIKTTFYIHNPNKARKNLDYKYQDWEERKPDIYDYIILKNHTSTTNHASDLIITETRRQDFFKPETTTSTVLESFQYNTLNSSTATYPTLPSTESTPGTSLPTPSIDSTPLSISPSFSTPYNTTTTTLTPEVSTKNIVIKTTSPFVLLSESIRNEINEAIVKLRGGYFTASVYVLLKILEKKKPNDIRSLLVGLHNEFSRLKLERRLEIFGPNIPVVLASVVRMMATMPGELVQLQAINGQELLENKWEEFQGDIKSIFDVIDAIYVEDDFINIVQSLTDIQEFPNISKSRDDVAEQAMNTFFFIPLKRIEGTAKEKVLLMELSNVVQNRMFLDDKLRPYFRSHVKITTEMTSSETKFRGKKLTKAQIRKAFVRHTLYTDPVTLHSSETDYTSYVKRSKIMKRLRLKMRNSNYKFRQSRAKERNFNKTRRLPTTFTATTTTTNTTYKSLMHKNKNKIKRSKTTPTKFENNIIKDKKSKMEIKNINIYNKPDSSDSNAKSLEKYLEVNLNDALFHTNNITTDRRFIKKNVNKLHKMDSFSDDEAILKGNIYKVFGYSNDFAKQLRAML